MTAEVGCTSQPALRISSSGVLRLSRTSFHPSLRQPSIWTCSRLGWPLSAPSLPRGPQDCDSPDPRQSRAAKGGGVQTGAFPDLDLSFLFGPLWDFPDFSGIFPICSGMVRGFSRLVLFLFLGLLRAPTRNSPERVRDTIWTFPQESGWKPPCLASLKTGPRIPVSWKRGSRGPTNPHFPSAWKREFSVEQKKPFF